MHDFEVTVWPDHSHYSVEVSSDCTTDLYALDPDEAKELLDCITQVLAGNECDHTVVHRVIAKPGNMYMVLFSVSERLSKAYTVNKVKLTNLRVRLMGALNG